MNKLIGLLRRRRVGRFLLLLTADLVLFSITNARTAPSYMIIIGFGLLAATIYYVTYGLISLSRLYGLRVKRQRILALYITAVTAGLIALQSIGELGGHDVLVLLPLALIGYLYSSYAKNGRDLSG